MKLESLFNKLNTRFSNTSRNEEEVTVCIYCNKPFNEKLWCKECDPHRIIEGWSSGNLNIDKFIKDTMYNSGFDSKFLEWVPFDKFTDVEQIGEGGFTKV